MTNERLDEILRNIDLKYCRLIDEMDKVNIYITQINGPTIEKSTSKYYAYTFAIITNKKDIPVGIILKMDTLDIHVYTLPEHRKHGYMKSALNSRELYSLWEDVETISIKSPNIDDPDLIGRYYSVLMSLWGEKIAYYDNTVFNDKVDSKQAIIDYMVCIDRQANDGHNTLKRLINEIDDIDDQGNSYEASEIVKHINENFRIDLVL